MRTRTLVLLAVTVTVLPIALATVAQAWQTPPRVAARPVAHARPTPETRALTLLRRWDRQRSSAWASGDRRGLARLYVSGSRTGRRDAADLGRWVDRGLRVTGLRQQVVSCQVVRAVPSSVTVEVVDRTVDGVAEGHGRRTAVPTSAWATHRIRLVRARGHRGWQVAEAWAQPAR
jgi:hypothetical protein